MKIVICSSAFFVEKAEKIKEKIKSKHEVFLYPLEVEFNGKKISILDYYKLRKKKLTKDLLKIKTELIKEHIKKIENSDAILVLNFDKENIKGYIGGNTFLEIVIAYYLNKKIFLWKKPSKKLPYYEEILALKPIILNESIEKLLIN